MIKVSQILPGMGRGTIRRMVEGGSGFLQLCKAGATRPTPSVSAPRCHLAVPERI